MSRSDNRSDRARFRASRVVIAVRSRTSERARRRLRARAVFRFAPVAAVSSRARHGGNSGHPMIVARRSCRLALFAGFAVDRGCAGAAAGAMAGRARSLKSGLKPVGSGGGAVPRARQVREHRRSLHFEERLHRLLKRFDDTVAVRGLSGLRFHGCVRSPIAVSGGREERILRTIPVRDVRSSCACARVTPARGSAPSALEAAIEGVVSRGPLASIPAGCRRWPISVP